MNFLSKSFLFLYIIGLFIHPSVSHALECDIVGSGFSNSAFNTTWTDTGVLRRGLPTFTQGTHYLAINPIAYDVSLLYWIIDTTDESTGGFPSFKAYSGPTTYLGTYTQNVGGLPADGTMTEDCGGEEPPEEEPVEIIPFNFDHALLFNTASSTCTQVGTTSPVVFNCVGTSTEPVITYRDWLFVNSLIIFLLMFVPLGFITNVITKRR